MRWLSCVFICLALLGCAASEVVREGPIVKAQTLLLLPLESLFEELDDEDGTVYKALIASLEGRRFDILDVDKQTHASAVDEALTETGAIYNPDIGRLLPANRDHYIKALIDYYAEQTDADVVLMPEFVIREAKVSGDHAEWDQVRRKLELHDKPPGPYRPVSQVRGVSLRLASYTAGGAQIARTYAGVSLPYRIDYTRTPPGFVLKEQFYTRKQINEAVDLVTSHFFRHVEYYEQ